MAKNTGNQPSKSGASSSGTPVAISPGPMSSSQSMSMMKDNKGEPTDAGATTGPGNENTSDTSLPVASMLGTQLTTVMVPTEMGKSKEFTIESNLKQVSEARLDLKLEVKSTPALSSTSAASEDQTLSTTAKDAYVISTDTSKSIEETKTGGAQSVTATPKPNLTTNKFTTMINDASEKSISETSASTIENKNTSVVDGLFEAIPLTTDDAQDPSQSNKSITTLTDAIDDKRETQSGSPQQLLRNFINLEPIASNDNYQLNEDEAFTLTQDNLLSNDIDSNGDNLSIVSIANAMHGNLSFDELTKSIIYTPLKDYHGADSFTYVISDSRGGQSTAVVKLSIHALNDAPVAISDIIFLNEDASTNFTAAQLLANDSDADLDTLSLTSVLDASNGSVSLSNGIITFIPAANYSGPAGFSYTLSDGHGGTSIGHVNLFISAVNDNPVIITDSFVLNEDSALSINASSLLANDTDVEGNTLTITSVQGATNGAVSLSGGNVIFTPALNYNGPAQFTYTISDGQGGTSTGAVNLTINAVNDAPVVVNDSFVLNEDNALNIHSSSLLANDTDVEGNTLTITSVQGATNGTVTLSGGSIIFTPALNYNGPATFSYTVSDGHGGTTVGTVALTVSAVNDTPVQIANSFTGNFNAPIIINLSSLVSDAETNSFTSGNVSISLANPSLGSVSFNPTTQSITFTPTTGLTGAIGLVFSITDNGDNGSTPQTLSASANVVIPSLAPNITIKISDTTSPAPNYTGSDTYTVTDPGVYGTAYTTTGAMMNTSGIANSDSVQVNYANANTVTVSESAGSLRNVQAISSTNASVMLSNFDRADVSLAGSGTSTVTLSGGITSATITTASGDDTITTAIGTSASAVNNAISINSGAGNDTITLTGGNTSSALSINAGSGNNTVTLSGATYLSASTATSQGVDFIYTGAGQNTVLAGSGSDYIKTSTGVDNISGEAGNDLIFVSTGNDTYTGGAGNDLFVFTANLAAGFGQTISGGTQYDVIRLPNTSGWTITIGGTNYTSSSSDITNLSEASGTITFTGGSTVTFSGINDFVWKGTYAESSSTSITGSNSNDDVLIGSNAAQTFNSRNSSSGDYVYGLGGNDTITTGTGADRIFAGVGNDSVTAGSGNDFIYDDQGNDVYRGGAGNDMFIFDTSYTMDTDYVYGNMISGAGTAGLPGTGGSGTDTLQLSNTATWTVTIGSNTYNNSSSFISGTNLSGQVTYTDGTGHTINFYDIESVTWA